MSSFLAAFRILVCVWLFSNVTMMFLGVVFNKFLMLGVLEVFEFMSYCHSSVLVKFQPLFSDCGSICIRTFIYLFLKIILYRSSRLFLQHFPFFFFF